MTVLAWMFVAAAVVGLACLLSSLVRGFRCISTDWHNHNSAGPDGETH